MNHCNKSEMATKLPPGNAATATATSTAAAVADAATAGPSQPKITINIKSEPVASSSNGFVIQPDKRGTKRPAPALVPLNELIRVPHRKMIEIPPPPPPTLLLQGGGAAALRVFTRSTEEMRHLREQRAWGFNNVEIMLKSKEWHEKNVVAGRNVNIEIASDDLKESDRVKAFMEKPVEGDPAKWKFYL